MIVNNLSMSNPNLLQIIDQIESISNPLSKSNENLIPQNLMLKMKPKTSGPKPIYG